MCLDGTGNIVSNEHRRVPRRHEIKPLGDPGRTIAPQRGLGPAHCQRRQCGDSVGNGARGDDNEIIPLEVKAGDRVLFGKWSGTEVKIDGEDLLIMKESDILGIIEASAAAKKAA